MRFARDVRRAAEQVQEGGLKGGQLNQEQARTIADPDEEEGSDVECGELELWRLLPQLKDLPEDWIKKLPNFFHI